MKRLQRREIEPNEGAFGWAISRDPYGLPDDLPHGTLVKVIRDRLGDVTVTVRNAEGKEWTLLRGILEPRAVYFCSRTQKWWPERSARAQELLREEIHWAVKDFEMEVEKLRELYWWVRRSAEGEDLAKLERIMETDPLRWLPEDFGGIGPGSACTPW